MYERYFFEGTRTATAPSNPGYIWSDRDKYLSKSRKEMKKSVWTRVFTPLILAASASLIAGCGSGSGSDPVPVIQNIDSSTTATSPVDLPIEINGSGFLAAPGKVVFTQGNISASVVPSSAGWTDTGLIAVVPAGNGTTNFTLPGTVSVTVVTAGGTSNAVNLNLVPTFQFVPSAMSWGTTTALPGPLTGLRAIGVPGSTSTSAYVIVTGGYDGITNNTPAVLSNTLNADGTIGANWTAISTNPLPSSRAHHAIAEADDTNSLVPLGKRYVYVIGGQQLSTDTPGGTNTVYVASVDSTSGAVGSWTALTNVLPQSLVGLSATVHNGYLYVAGGVASNGTPSSAVYSAPVNPDGTIGTWTTSTNSLPVTAGPGFGEMFVFGGQIYWIDGDPSGSQLLPNSATTVGETNVYYASAIRGVVGLWNPTSSTIHNRTKGLVFTAYGQVISAEGLYTGSPGSGEMETSTFNSDGTLQSWNGLTGSSSQVPKANVYNAAGLVSPLVTSTFAPRFLILGGATFSTTPAPTSTVYYNTAP